MVKRQLRRIVSTTIFLIMLSSLVQVAVANSSTHRILSTYVQEEDKPFTDACGSDGDGYISLVISSDDRDSERVRIQGLYAGVLEKVHHYVATQSVRTNQVRLALSLPLIQLSIIVLLLSLIFFCALCFHSITTGCYKPQPTLTSQPNLTTPQPPVLKPSSDYSLYYYLRDTELSTEGRTELTKRKQWFNGWSCVMVGSLVACVILFVGWVLYLALATLGLQRVNCAVQGFRHAAIIGDFSSPTDKFVGIDGVKFVVNQYASLFNNLNGPIPEAEILKTKGFDSASTNLDSSFQELPSTGKKIIELARGDSEVLTSGFKSYLSIRNNELKAEVRLLQETCLGLYSAGVVFSYLTYTNQRTSISQFSSDFSTQLDKNVRQPLDSFFAQVVGTRSSAVGQVKILAICALVVGCVVVGLALVESGAAVVLGSKAAGFVFPRVVNGGVGFAKGQVKKDGKMQENGDQQPEDNRQIEMAPRFVESEAAEMQHTPQFPSAGNDRPRLIGEGLHGLILADSGSDSIQLANIPNNKLLVTRVAGPNLQQYQPVHDLRDPDEEESNDNKEKLSPETVLLTVNDRALANADQLPAITVSTKPEDPTYIPYSAMPKIMARNRKAKELYGITSCLGFCLGIICACFAIASVIIVIVFGYSCKIIDGFLTDSTYYDTNLKSSNLLTPQQIKIVSACLGPDTSGDLLNVTGVKGNEDLKKAIDGVHGLNLFGKISKANSTQQNEFIKVSIALASFLRNLNEKSSESYTKTREMLANNVDDVTTKERSCLSLLNDTDSNTSATQLANNQKLKEVTELQKQIGGGYSAITSCNFIRRGTLTLENSICFGIYRYFHFQSIFSALLALSLLILGISSMISLGIFSSGESRRLILNST
jgi:hypothetical protein